MASSKSSQSSFRRFLFWSHLITGVAVGIVIFILALTGALLTYEAQIKEMFEPRIEARAGQTAMLSADELIAIAAPAFPGRSASLSYDRDPSKPVEVRAGRRDVKLLDPYSGAFIEAPANPAQQFFHFVEDVHRSLSVGFDSWGADTIKAANLAFLFLIVSGAYLWLPRKWKWPFLKQRMVLSKMPTAKARDFNWHHVFSFWILIPLLAVVGTGVVFSYDWASKATYNSLGLEAPVHGKRPQPSRGSAGSSTSPTGPLVSYQSILETAQASQSDWTSISLTIPSNPNAKSVNVLVDRGNGKQASKETKLVISRESGEVEKVQGPEAPTASTQSLRRYIRFLHTGEVYGIIGQTLAGLASLASVLLVWTGFALAWRRLISPLFRPKAKPTITPMAS